jgi:hypothetical protein
LRRYPELHGLLMVSLKVSVVTSFVVRGSRVYLYASLSKPSICVRRRVPDLWNFGLGRRVHRATADVMSSFEVESFEEMTFECVAGAISSKRHGHHNDQLIGEYISPSYTTQLNAIYTCC